MTALIHRIPNRDHQGATPAEPRTYRDYLPAHHRRPLQVERTEYRPGDRVLVRVDRPSLVVGGVARG